MIQTFTKFSAWIATTGAIALSPMTLASSAMAQDTFSPPASPTPDASPEITEFLVDFVPDECTVQLGYFEGDEVEVVGTQSVETLLADNPLRPCNSVSGTDSGETKNFNFVSDEIAVYKLITESEPVGEATPNEFTVLAMQIIPFNESGELDNEETIQLSFIDEGVCEVDSAEDTNAVVCEFTSLSDAPSAAMGRLTYSW